MEKRRVSIVFVVVMALVLLLTSCSGANSAFVDGYYTAQTDKFDSHGWKEFVTICVSGGRIVTVEYNAINPSGMVKAWDMNYMRTMNRVAGSYPNQYTRAYGGDLLAGQSADNIDVVTGATHSYHTFELLGAAVIELAKNGEEHIVFVAAEE